ncbi:uncharacterized protein LOC119675317 [Teleopsis dalmanni]|uniref:uncharacterized protein LOC119675317 n=1 Tax=Teleopsis dalmanni TaxID=139649 RepID=UPI0018CF4EC8|nr:uncharacterized protein LOC119675317 [Teleopsis dalmanni]
MLRRKNVKFTWGSAQQQAFIALKMHILNAAHYQEQLPLVLAIDASSYGIGVVLLHTYVDGTERPIASASKSLEHFQSNSSVSVDDDISFTAMGYYTNGLSVCYDVRYRKTTDHGNADALFH